MEEKKEQQQEQAPSQLITEHGEPFDIPKGGSLGLLAFGYVGLMLWREKRNQLKMENEKLRMKNEK